MPTLIPETGAPTANANSYATLEYIRQYALDRGIELNDDDDVVSSNAIRAMDYIATFARHFQGVRTFVEQLLDWPRTGVIVDGIEYTVDYMPVQLAQAQAAAVIQIHNGIELLPTTQGPQVKVERLGPMSFEYFSQRGLEPVTVPIIDNILAPLLAYQAVLASRRI
jgi:hypothetical protein